jgi:virginiamycin B lyase
MNRRKFLTRAVATAIVTPALIRGAQSQMPAPFRVSYFPVAHGTKPRDTAPAPDGSVWFCGQRNGTLGRLDPRDGSCTSIEFGPTSGPHNVVFGPDGALWVTVDRPSCIVRVNPETLSRKQFDLPATLGRTNIQTGVFDTAGVYWFTAHFGFYGRLDPKSEEMSIWNAPRGAGPKGITCTPNGDIWFCSIAGNYIAQIDRETGEARVVEPPTSSQGARRVWSDSKGRIWVSEWGSGHVSVHDPSDGSWRQWKLPGKQPRPNSVYVDEKDIVWLSDFGANAIVRFDPTTENFLPFPSDMRNSNVRHLTGRPGEVWGSESGTHRLVVIETNPRA